MPATHKPRFATYELYDRHTGATVSTHPSRRAAESHITSHAHRVRGGKPISRGPSFLDRLLGRVKPTASELPR